MSSSYARCSVEGAHRRTPAPSLAALALAVLVAACAPTEVTVSPTTRPTPKCAISTAVPGDVATADPVEAAVLVSSAVFECAHTVVVAPVAELAGASTVADGLLAPVLVAGDDGSLPAASRTELERLDPDRVIVVSADPTLPWDKRTAGAGGSWDLEVRPAPAPPPTSTPGTEGRPESTASSATTTTGTDPEPTAEASASASAANGTGTTVVPPPDSPPIIGPVWLAQTDDLRWATAASLHAAGFDVLSSSDPVTRVEGEVRVIGDFTPSERWAATIVLNGADLPGGGYFVFPGRRFIAFYGSPVTFRLGLLGETAPEQAVERLDDYLAQYDTSAGPLIPTFELIVTVADSRPGDDGDYSRELTLEQVEPWIDVITDAGGYAILDLQPGRTDFLTQAKRYEELLRRPNVGLALDPEWRLRPDQVHLRQIGSVDAPEVNLVVDWLAELVREEHLPQKILVLHQFDWGMITNRADIVTPPELAVVLHVDGQGPLTTKYGTWQAMQDVPRGAEQQLWWGWKNFIDEDSPMATPTEVDNLEPLPLVVTYQ